MGPRFVATGRLLYVLAPFHRCNRAFSRANRMAAAWCRLLFYVSLLKKFVSIGLSGYYAIIDEICTNKQHRLRRSEAVELTVVTDRMSYSMILSIRSVISFAYLSLSSSFRNELPISFFIPGKSFTYLPIRRSIVFCSIPIV